jgi:predicted 3-demethylubiquinone-9 3-methyltransferase (glyoxalase superfamily)
LCRGKDRFGVSWQIVPEALGRMHSQGSSDQVGRMMAALMRMSKLDIAALQAAYDEGASG